MKHIQMLLTTIIVIVSVISVSGVADVPQMINYQGWLTDSPGDPLDTIISMAFTIYDEAENGNIRWSETQPTVTVNSGLFNILLGSINPLDDSVFGSAECWLGIQVGGDPEISPRTHLVSVAYAHCVSTVDGAAGGVISDSLTVTGSVHITDGGLKFPDGSIQFTQAGASNGLPQAGGTMTGPIVSVGDPPIQMGKGNFGTDNTNEGQRAFVAGQENEASGDFCTVSGGYQNVASAITEIPSGSAVLSGNGPSRQGQGATVGGGANNTASGSFSTVGGGQANTTSNNYAAIAGGASNLASGDASSIGGGFCDTATGNYSTISGGYINTAVSHYGTVSGGAFNAVSGQDGTVGGGRNNVASGNLSTVGGGSNNTAVGFGSTVSGGTANTSSNNYSTVAGGTSNSASGDASAICGGFSNSNSGNYSVIPGGHGDTLTSGANYALAFGHQVYVANQYRVVFFDSTYHGRLGLNRDDNDGGILHPIHVGTNTSNGNGAHLTAGGNWVGTSSKEFKENGEFLDSKAILEKIEALPVQAWQYIGIDERHIGPYSEDFVRAFDVGSIRANGTREEHYLSAGDVAGVALIGIQELNRELRLKTNEIENLKTEVAQLRSLIEALIAQQYNTE